MPSLRTVAALAAAATGMLSPALASAHFVLQAPPNWAQQDSSGLPEKSAPCGQADPGGPAAVATNVVTPFSPGDTITVTVTEAVPHPGWYKAVLAVNDRSELPPDPMPTGGACGNVTADGGIVGLTPENPPVFPVLVDGALFHASAMSAGPHSFTVTLPTDKTCTHCTLQIVEFMSAHGAPCYYHHCADISIQGTPTDAGGATGGGGMGGSGADAATGGESTSSGCGCSLGRSRPSQLGTLLVFGLLLGLRRRRRLRR